MPPFKSSLPDGAHPAVARTPVEALTVVTQQDGTVSLFTDGEFDGETGLGPVDGCCHLGH
jgi:hypothetical protein